MSLSPKICIIKSRAVSGSHMEFSKLWSEFRITKMILASVPKETYGKLCNFTFHLGKHCQAGYVNLSRKPRPMDTFSTPS